MVVVFQRRESTSNKSSSGSNIGGGRARLLRFPPTIMLDGSDNMSGQ